MSDPCVGDVEYFSLCERRRPLSQQLGPSLNVAIWKEELDVIEHLLKGMPSIANWSDPSTGNGPLHIAACTGNATIVQLLINVGADVNKCSDKGYNPLHIAAWSDSLACVELLLSAGCDVDQEVRKVNLCYVPFYSCFDRASEV